MQRRVEGDDVHLDVFGFIGGEGRRGFGRFVVGVEEVEVSGADGFDGSFLSPLSADVEKGEEGDRD